MPFDGGGGGGQPAQQTSTTVTQQELSPQQQQLLELAVPFAETFGQQPLQLFPGQTIAPRGPLELEGQQLAIDLARSGLPDFLGPIAGGQQFLSSGAALFPQTNPALQAATEAAVRPLTQAFEQNILPNIRGEANLAGQFGGSRQGIAEGIAGQGLLQSVGDVSATMQSQAYQTALENMTRSLFAAPGITGLTTLPSDILSTVGAGNRAFEQAQINEQVQRFSTEQLLPLLQAQGLAGLAMGLPGGQTIAQSTGPSPFGTTSPWQTGFAGAAGGAALGGMFGQPLLGGILGGLGGWIFG